MGENRFQCSNTEQVKTRKGLNLLGAVLNTPPPPAEASESLKGKQAYFTREKRRKLVHELSRKNNSLAS